MQKRLTLLLLAPAAVVLALSGCPTDNTMPDMAVADQAVAVDQAAAADMTAAGDMTALDLTTGPDLSGDSCSKVVICTAACKDAPCRLACVASASAKAQELFGKLSACGLMACATPVPDAGAPPCSGPNDQSEACLGCIAERTPSACAAELAACLADM